MNVFYNAALNAGVVILLGFLLVKNRALKLSKSTADSLRAEIVKLTGRPRITGRINKVLWDVSSFGSDAPSFQNSLVLVNLELQNHAQPTTVRDCSLTVNVDSSERTVYGEMNFDPVYSIPDLGDAIELLPIQNEMGGWVLFRLRGIIGVPGPSPHFETPWKEDLKITVRDSTGGEHIINHPQTWIQWSKLKPTVLDYPVLEFIVNHK